MKSNWSVIAGWCATPCSEIFISVAWGVLGVVAFATYMLSNRERLASGGWLSHLALQVFDCALEIRNLPVLLSLEIRMLALKIGMFALKARMLALKVRILSLQVINIAHNRGIWCGVCSLFSPNDQVEARRK